MFRGSKCAGSGGSNSSSSMSLVTGRMTGSKGFLLCLPTPVMKVKSFTTLASLPRAKGNGAAKTPVVGEVG